MRRLQMKFDLILEKVNVGYNRGCVAKIFTNRFRDNHAENFVTFSDRLAHPSHVPSYLTDCAVSGVRTLQLEYEQRAPIVGS